MPGSMTRWLRGIKPMGEIQTHKVTPAVPAPVESVTMLDECKLPDRIAIAKHCASPAGGMGQELLDYLRPRVEQVVSIDHPFPYANMPLNSTLKVYERGRQTSALQSPAPRGPAPLFYLLDVLFTVYFFVRARLKVDLFVAFDNLNTFAALVLRRLGLVRSVVFYVIDYVPQRFESRLLNDIYHWLDKYCCYQADSIWNVSPNMMAARKAKWHTLDGVAHNIVVPLGCAYERIERLPIDEINRHDVMFLGSLLREQGIHLLVETWPTVVARVPDATLVIVGHGDQEELVKRRIQELGIAPRIRFIGFVADDVEVERIVARCAVGVAPYTEDAGSFKYYADPGKVKFYLAAGLPVVITKVPPIAEVIQAAQAGMAIRHDAVELAAALVTLLTDDGLYARYRANAIALAARYSWNRIFREALTQTLNRPRGR